VKYFRLHIILQIRHKVLKILLFYKNTLKNKKALQQMPKGWKLSAPPIGKL
jgi:hypothetical protein